MVYFLAGLEALVSTSLVGFRLVYSRLEQTADRVIIGDGVSGHVLFY